MRYKALALQLLLIIVNWKSIFKLHILVAQPPFSPTETRSRTQNYRRGLLRIGFLKEEDRSLLLVRLFPPSTAHDREGPRALTSPGKKLPWRSPRYSQLHGSKTFVTDEQLLAMSPLRPCSSALSLRHAPGGLQRKARSIHQFGSSPSTSVLGNSLP